MYRWQSPSLLIFLLCLVCGPAGTETVYRTVDADGSVIYSDRPMPGAEPIELPEWPPVPAATPWRPIRKLSPEESIPFPSYESVAIASPAPDSAAWYPTGQVTVSVTTQPPLQEGHTLVLYLNGRRVAENQTTTFQLHNVHRGTHRLEAAVHAHDGELRRSETVRFHVLKPSLESPQRRQDAASPPPAAPGGPGNPPRATQGLRNGTGTR